MHTATLVFRIDDVSVNTDLNMLAKTVGTLRHHVADVRIVAAISPLVHDVAEAPLSDRERAFPRVLSAMSDHRNMFKVRRLGVPNLDGLGVAVASHGLVHVDHRLMGREAQELSIVTSCSLMQTTAFVPPFNKYDADTIDICKEHGIELFRFEDGWQHVRFNDFNRNHQLYYFHTHDTDVAFLEKWLAP